MLATALVCVALAVFVTTLTFLEEYMGHQPQQPYALPQHRPSYSNGIVRLRKRVRPHYTDEDWVRLNLHAKGGNLLIGTMVHPHRLQPLAPNPDHPSPRFIHIGFHKLRHLVHGKTRFAISCSRQHRVKMGEYIAYALATTDDLPLYIVDGNLHGSVCKRILLRRLRPVIGRRTKFTGLCMGPKRCVMLGTPPHKDLLLSGRRLWLATMHEPADIADTVWTHASMQNEGQTITIGSEYKKFMHVNLDAENVSLFVTSE